MPAPSQPLRLHLDTDFAGDPDDACALVMLLGWPGVELTSITTVADPDGQRAGYVQHVLAMLGRSDIPVAVGAGKSSTTGRAMGGLPDHELFWGTPAPPPAAEVREGAATGLLSASIRAGAVVAAVGPYTNLAVLERAMPGQLEAARVVVMGGWLDGLGAAYPPWGPRRDWNVVCDLDAAELVAASAGEITWAPIPGTIDAQLRLADLGRLRGTGLVGQLLTRLSLAHGELNQLPALAGQHPGLHDDLVNFHWDPVTCAVAVGWPGAVVGEERVATLRRDESMRLVRSGNGSSASQARPARIVTSVDGSAFTESWLSAVAQAQHR